MNNQKPHSNPYNMGQYNLPGDAFIRRSFSPPKPVVPTKKHDDKAYGKLNKSVVELAEILAHRRNGFTEGEKRFVAWLKDQLPKNAFFDAFGNIHYSSYPDNKAPQVLFSCHTDTVHRNSEKEFAQQKVLYDSILDQFFVDEPDKAHCLGADDGTGVWIMLNMIRAKVPGYYIFHRMEEKGGQGSRWIASNMKNMLRSVKIAVAFDRKGTKDIITHQGRQTASVRFAEQLAVALNDEDKAFEYAPSDGGLFTDTAVYADIVPECTNIAVGYARAHSPNEFQDVGHATKLLEACCTLEWHKLEASRDPKAKPKVVVPAKTTAAPVKKKIVVKEDLTYEDADFIIRRFPEIATELLVQGATFDDFEDLLAQKYEEIFVRDWDLPLK